VVPTPSSPPRSQAKDAPHAPLDFPHEVARDETCRMWVQVAAVDGHQCGHVRYGVLRQPGGGRGRKTLPGIAASAMFDVKTAPMVVAKRLRLYSSA